MSANSGGSYSVKKRRNYLPMNNVLAQDVSSYETTSVSLKKIVDKIDDRLNNIVKELEDFGVFDKEDVKYLKEMRKNSRQKNIVQLEKFFGKIDK